MAVSLNREQIIGNLTRDPELRQTPSGQTVATIGVATNRKWKNASGELQEETEFHNIVVWGKLAEICGQYLRKGKKVYFEGRLKTRMWEDETGKKNYRTEIIAENMIMLGDRPDATSGITPTPMQKKAAEPVPAVAAAPAQEEEIQIDDLPF